MAASLIAYARIERGIDEIDDEVDSDVESGKQHHHALDQRKVVPRDALHEQPSKPVQAEDLFGDDETAKQKREFEPDDGHRWQQSVAQSVPADDHGFDDTLGACGADIVLTENLKQ